MRRRGLRKKRKRLVEGMFRKYVRRLADENVGPKGELFY